MDAQGVFVDVYRTKNRIADSSLETTDYLTIWNVTELSKRAFYSIYMQEQILFLLYASYAGGTAWPKYS